MDRRLQYRPLHRRRRRGIANSQNDEGGTGRQARPLYLVELKQGYDTWFLLTADYVFGHGLEKDVTRFVQANGGKIPGSVRHPLNTPDFSSFLLQAQASNAKVVGLANAGTDTINAVKQAAEFGDEQAKICRTVS